MVVHAVAAGQASGHLVPLLYEVADDRDLLKAARGEEDGMALTVALARSLRNRCLSRPVTTLAPGHG
jgi:hypothetical protein